MKQILFNTEMVRTILDDRKTQTRRPIDWDISNNMSGDAASGYLVQTDNGLIDALKLYRYQKGDILYVRETWKVIVADPTVNFLYIKYIADKQESYVEFARDRFEKFRKYERKNGNHANIFMPKEAARIFLKVTDVRVEKLQDIKPDGAIAEGLNVCCDCKEHGGCYLPNVCAYLPNTFKKVWDKIYQSRGYGWDTNCWVWIIEFERCEKPDEN